MLHSNWKKIATAIGRAMQSCKTLGVNIDDHFREVTKMVKLGSGAEREVKDYMLTRYACYLIAQNGDPKKEEVAFAQSYFAVQTRRAELIEERINYIARLESRTSTRIRISRAVGRPAGRRDEIHRTLRLQVHEALHRHHGSCQARRHQPDGKGLRCQIAPAVEARRSKRNRVMKKSLTYIAIL